MLTGAHKKGTPFRAIIIWPGICKSRLGNNNKLKRSLYLRPERCTAAAEAAEAAAAAAAAAVAPSFRRHGSAHNSITFTNAPPREFFTAAAAAAAPTAIHMYR